MCLTMGRKDKKTSRGGALPRVAAEVHAKGLSKRQAAKKFVIPESTLLLHLKKLANNQMATAGYVHHRRS